MKFRWILWVFAIFANGVLYAQKDTAVKPSVTIISTYKPVLISPAKINLYGSPLPADTNREVRTYNIPSQNYVYSYESVSLNPLKLQTDSNELFRTLHHFVKVGFGNLKTPYLGAGVFFNKIPSMLVSANVSSISSKGSIKNQDYSMFSLKSNGSYFLKNNEANANIAYNRNQFYLYGYDHTLYDFNKKDIAHLMNDFSFSLGIRNTNKNLVRLYYHPVIGLNVFSLKDSLIETTTNLMLPVEYRFNDKFTSGIFASIDATSVSITNQPSPKEKFSNNVSSIKGFVKFKSDYFNVDAGAAAISNAGHWSFLPDIKGEMPLSSSNVILVAGWIGKVNKNTYRNLSGINPYLKGQSVKQNTIEKEMYGGIKSNIGKYISVSAKAGWERYKNFQFFLNDTAAGSILNAYTLSNEERINNFSLHGELSYVKNDKFSLMGEVTFNGYTGMKVNARAWNTLPMEARINFMSQVNKKMKISGSFYLFAGGHYLQKGNISKVYEGGSDLSLSAEYKISKMFVGFLHLNNIFGKSYERWRYYPVYGFNGLGGLKVNF